MISNVKQIEILHDSARACGLDGHIYDEKPQTAAEKVMVMFGAAKHTPRKNSYLYCDSVDACFYIQRNVACCTFTAKWLANSSDLDKLQKAGQIIKNMLQEMQNRLEASK